MRDAIKINDGRWRNGRSIKSSQIEKMVSVTPNWPSQLDLGDIAESSSEVRVAWVISRL